jgi:hypothetical protein
VCCNNADVKKSEHPREILRKHRRGTHRSDVEGHVQRLEQYIFYLSVENNFLIKVSSFKMALMFRSLQISVYKHHFYKCSHSHNQIQTQILFL